MNKNMKHRIAAITGSFALFLCVMSASTHAALDTAKGNATQKQLSATANNIVNITWQITTTAGHTLGAQDSSPAQIWDPTANAALPGTFGGALTRTGAGPFSISETLTIPGTQVQTWLNAGATRIVVRRVFTGGNTLIATTAAISLSSSNLAAARSGSVALNIQRLHIALDEQENAVKVLELNGAIQPMLTVNYAGTGLLEGQWQVAEPGSTEGKPLYRTLALVRQQLVKAQQSEFKGPVLPTHRSGKYLLRFCVRPAAPEVVLNGGDVSCPDPQLTVQAAYQVLQQEAPLAEMVLYAPQQQSVNNEFLFQWQAVTGAALYKLSIMEVQANHQNGDQWFVTGILLPQNVTQTTLTELMQQKLKSGGMYRWQVDAINEQGQLLASSKQASFTYQP